MFDHQFIVIFMAMFKTWYKERYRIHAGLKTAWDTNTFHLTLSPFVAFF